MLKINETFVLSRVTELSCVLNEYFREVFKITPASTFLFFFSECLVDTIASCEIGSHHDALVYTAGALKHLSSNNPTAQKELVSLQGIEGLAQILDAISKDVSI